MRYNSTGTNVTYTRPVYFDNFTDAVRLANTSSPVNAKSPEVKNIDDPNLFAYDPVTARGYFTEDQYIDYQKGRRLDCRTNGNVSSCAYNPNNKVFYYDSTAVIFNVCLPLQGRILGYANFVGDLKAGYVNDLKNTWWIILLAVISTVLIGIVFLVIATYFLPCLLWVQIAISVIALISLGVIGIITASDVNSDRVNAGLQRASEYDASVKARFATLKDRIWILWVVSIVLIILGFLLAYIVWTSRRGIYVALGVLKFASIFVTKHILIVVVALVCFAIQVLTFLLTIWLLLIIHTSGDIEQDYRGSPLPTFHYTTGKWILWYLGIFTVYWAVIFWNNFADITCAGTACNYYFGNSNGVISTSIKAMTFHSGSIALVSLILLPVTII